jgi:hypothetical protein
MSLKLHQSGAQRIPRLSDVCHCGRLATDMLQGALDSLARMDIDGARQVIGADKAIDAAFNAILRQLITYMMEDPRTISEALDIIWIAKAIERVGDHATNIAENVIYIVSGIDIRHTAVAARKRTTHDPTGIQPAGGPRRRGRQGHSGAAALHAGLWRLPGALCGHRGRGRAPAARNLAGHRVDRLDAARQVRPGADAQAAQ